MEKILPEWIVQTRICPSKEHADVVAIDTLANNPLSLSPWKMKGESWIVVATFQIKAN